MTTAFTSAASIFCIANRLRKRTPYSSAVLVRIVPTRQFATHVTGDGFHFAEQRVLSRCECAAVFSLKPLQQRDQQFGARPLLAGFHLQGSCQAGDLAGE